jgi:glycosyltransferase involved in cell wall biosynthesis
MMGSPEVLAFMPVYNACRFVGAAIESILCQTYRDFQILVINDGSTDGSEQLIKTYQDRGVILWHQENRGPGASMNRAIQYAHDHHIEFIARFDADDISLPDRLEKQVALMKKYPDSAAFSANCFYIDPESENIFGSSTVSTSQKLIRWEISSGLRGLIQGVTLFRTEALVTIGGYREQFKGAEETDVFLRLIEKYELNNSSAYLAKIRITPGSLSLRDVRKNILYQYYALDCAHKRHRNLLENDFNTFTQNLTSIDRYCIWREEKFLALWHAYLSGHHPLNLLASSLMDPRRVIIRILRKFS